MNYVKEIWNLSDKANEVRKEMIKESKSKKSDLHFEIASMIWNIGDQLANIALLLQTIKLD